MEPQFLSHPWRSHIGAIILFIALVTAVYITLNTEYEPPDASMTEDSVVILKQAPISTEGWKTYRNTQFKYELLYPADWRCRTAVGQGGTIFCATSTPNVVFEPWNTILSGGLKGLELSVLNTAFENVLIALETDSYRKSPIEDVVLPGFVGKKASITGVTGPDYEVIIVDLDEKRTVRFTYHTNETTQAILSSFIFIQ